MSEFKKGATGVYTGMGKASSSSVFEKMVVGTLTGLFILTRKICTVAWAYLPFTVALFVVFIMHSIYWGHPVIDTAIPLLAAGGCFWLLYKTPAGKQWRAYHAWKREAKKLRETVASIAEASRVELTGIDLDRNADNPNQIDLYLSWGLGETPERAPQFATQLREGLQAELVEYDDVNSRPGVGLFAIFMSNPLESVAAETWDTMTDETWEGGENNAA